MNGTFLSWGRVQRDTGECLPEPRGLDWPWPGENILPVGLGRSYGDVCLNREGRLLPMRECRACHGADWATGRIRVEGGFSLGELIETCLPQGWFPPVLPGTRQVTVGGAIANDVHGKNHHRAGTFGHHVTRLWLRRSDREYAVECSKEAEPELFHATIGGLGLTGVIVGAEIQLQRVHNGWMDVEFLPFETLEEFVGFTGVSDADWDYTVAWVDLMRAGDGQLPGIFMRGNHAPPLPGRKGHRPHKALARWPLELPVCPFNRWTVRTFNRLYHFRQKQRTGRFHQHYGSFFHPLDVLDDWNKLYGPGGFYQYQCVIPARTGLQPFREIFKVLAANGAVVPLAVMKQTGDLDSAGLLSFPMAGWTLAMDLPNQGGKTLRLFAELDRIVEEAQGRLYPAKDATMPAAFFQASYPDWQRLEAWRDPCIQSDFWRRVTPVG